MFKHLSSTEIPVGNSIDVAVDSIASKIISRKLETAAIFLLTLHLPLSTLVYSGAFAMLPFFRAILGSERCDELLLVLQSRDHIESLISRLEMARDAR